MIPLGINFRLGQNFYKIKETKTLLDPTLPTFSARTAPEYAKALNLGCLTLPHRQK